MPPEQLGSPKMPATMRIQGVLYLEDTSANGGGIRIVPGFHHKFEGWVGSIPEDDRGKNFGEQPTLAHLEPQVRTSPVLSLFILKMIILARQARDKHSLGKALKKRAASKSFLGGTARQMSFGVRCRNISMRPRTRTTLGSAGCSRQCGTRALPFLEPFL